ncbi:MAG: hypothetical protein QOD44_1830, partial [Solirubrobacteraceae bacterium]|nr:hypothetical protein [Solirubrobacteraceae bacterium]
TGTLLGAVEHPVLRDVELELAPGDTLVLYTDGVTEARTPEGMFGERRLAELLAGSAGLDAGAIVRRIEEAVADTADHSAVDDVAVLVIRATA